MYTPKDDNLQIQLTQKYDCDEIQSNLDLVTLLVSTKIVTKSHINVTKLNDFMQY